MTNTQNKPGQDSLPGVTDLKSDFEDAEERSEFEPVVRPYNEGRSGFFFIPVAIALSLFHIYANTIGLVEEKFLVGIHFAGFAFLAALRFPVYNAKTAKGRKIIWWVDIAFGAIVAISTLLIITSEVAIYARGVRFDTMNWITAIITIAGAIELTRRATGGIIIPCIVLVCLAYVSFLGPYIPGVFQFRGLGFETVLFRTIFNDEGMFGQVGIISATFVFMFILFGAFLVRSGAGNFIIAFAQAAAGRMVGGPGFVAVFSSGLTGTISGSAVANTVSTGVITIPLMKKSGFPPKFAAGVEAASSTGGQLMPPIMGAGAFVMASYTGIPYTEIVAVAFLPAILYFASVAFFVRIKAKQLKLVTTEEGAKSAMDVLKEGGASFLIPIAVLITLLIMGYSPTYCAGAAIVSVVVSSWITKNPMGPKAIYEALLMGARNMIMTAVLLVTVGVIVSVIATTGVGNIFSLMVAEWSGNNLLIAIILIAIASLVLGMGLPVTAAYIVLATLSAPALQGMIQNNAVIDAMVAGTLAQEAQAVFMLADPTAMVALSAPMESSAAFELFNSLPRELWGAIYPHVLDDRAVLLALLSAHMIIFWLSQDSNVTPPVCLTAFAAAAIAKTPPMATGVTAWRLSKGLYLVPVLFAYTPFLGGPLWKVIVIFLTALLALYALAAFFEGHIEAKIGWATRGLLAVLGVFVIWPNHIEWNIIAAIGIGIIVVLNVLADRRGMVNLTRF